MCVCVCTYIYIYIYCISIKCYIAHTVVCCLPRSRKDNEARKDRLLECTDIGTFEETGVDCDPQVAFKSPKDSA